FNKLGVWHYHDHENATRRGTITVVVAGSELQTSAATSTASTSTIQTQLVDCVKASSDFSCYDNYYSSLVMQKGVDAAFVDLKKRYEENAYVRSQCHPITHVIGNAAVKLYPDVSKAYTHGDGFCWSGYYHGVMEGIVGQIGKKAVATQLNTICADIPGKASYSFDYYNCVHGLGHGLMAITENDLFGALRTCDNLEGSWEKGSCYGGVFMENVIADGKDHSTKYLKPSDPLYPCDAVDQNYKGSCYLMQTSYMLTLNGGDFKKVFDLCATADKGYETVCYQSLGRDASGRSISNAETTKATCELGNGFEPQVNCIIGAVKDFISYYHSDVQAKHLCEIIDPSLTQTCNETADSYYKSFQ
ncbi:MAG TPA: hypothetical protein VE973_00430, partial [Candidatus Limnocylindria bacterium]|nr:hypothetical protein [Candidatus Limnocylindria bacterium]